MTRRRTPPRRARAFTLLELLISCACLTIVSGGIYALISGIEINRQRLERNADSAEALRTWSSAWRNGIERAARVEPAPGGNGVLVIYPDGAHATLPGPLALPPGMALRTAHVTPAGRGWRLDYTLALNDGRFTETRSGAITATPLLPAATADASPAEATR